MMQERRTGEERKRNTVLLHLQLSVEGREREGGGEGERHTEEGGQERRGEGREGRVLEDR